MHQRFSELLGEVAAGKIRSIPEEIAVKSFVPLFEIAELTGSLTSFLKLAKIFLYLPAANEAFWKAVLPLLKDLKAFQPPPQALASWNLSTKSEKHAILNNTADCRATSVSLLMIAGVYAGGYHYFELIIERLDSKNAIGICDSKVNDDKDLENQSPFAVMYFSKAVVTWMGTDLFKFKKCRVKDRIGVFIDMNIKKLSFYRNGLGKNKSLYISL